MAIDFRLMQGSQGSPLENAMAGYKFGSAMRADNQAQANKDESQRLRQTLSELMNDPEFNLAASTDFERLSQLSPESAQASQARFNALSKEDQDKYKQDMLMARDMMMNGDVEGGRTYLARRITQLTESGRRPDDSIRAFMIAQRDPEYFVQGVNQMLASDEQLRNRDISFQQQPGEAKVGRYRSIDKGNAIDILDSATGTITNTIPKAPGAKEQADLEIKKLEANQKRQAAIDKVFADQDGLSLATQAANLAAELAADERLSRVVGGKSYLSMTPTFGESQSLINKAQNLLSLVTKDNLGLMSGVLTDRDIDFLGRISSGGLNITDNGILGDYDTVVGQLNELNQRLTKSTQDKQVDIDKKLFINKQSNKLGRPIVGTDVQRLRAAGFNTRQIYNMLQVE